MKKLFVSLPMAGVSNEYIKTRMAEIVAYINETLTDGPYELLDTFIEKPNDISDQAGTYCLGRSISLLTDADLVIFDVNWRRARGCIIENMVCNLYHIHWMELTRPGEFA